jgi:hypothetical protein
MDSVQVSWNAKSPTIMVCDFSKMTVGERIMLLVHYRWGGVQATYAAHLGVSPQRLGNIIKGSGLSRPMNALMRQSVPGLTSMWLEEGDARGMPGDLLDDLARVAGRLSRKTAS